MKKFSLLFMLFLLGFMMIGCDLLSSLKAVRGFSSDYNIYMPIYENATFYTVSTDTSVTVIDTDIEHLSSFSDSMDFVIDKEYNRTFIDQTINGEEKKSVFQTINGFTIEYIINDKEILPTIPSSEERVDTNIFNTDNSFSLNDISNENVTGDHQYEFDIFLSEVVDLDKLTTLADQFSIFDNGLSVFDNALAHVVVSFTEAESVIDIYATLTEYEITFEDQSYATISISNHTIMTIPEEQEMIDVFSSEFVFLPVDDIRLATKVYNADTLISLPLLAQQNGWIQLYLEEGTYDVSTTSYGYISDSYLTYFNQDKIAYNPVNGIQFTIMTPGYYYFYLIPSVDCNLDLTFVKLPE